MALTNVIFKGYDNPVIINITGIEDDQGNAITLNDFSVITAEFKGDSRNTTDNPESVIVASSTQLKLFFGDTDKIGEGNWTISGTYATKDYLLSDCCKANLDKTKVC